MALKKATYVEDAENVIKSLKKNKQNDISLTTNKIRNVLSLINELYGMAKMSKDETLSEEIRSHAQYVKMRLVYEAGRENDVRDLLEKSDLLKHIDSINNSREQLILVCHYMEALVAYHKYLKQSD